jgi:hypothetical protein
MLPSFLPPSHTLHHPRYPSHTSIRHGHNPSPQVPGCNKDLSSFKKYYQRYKLCAEHLNLSCLIINGAPSRFCQKCVNFHEISAFDDEKRCAQAPEAEAEAPPPPATCSHAHLLMTCWHVKSLQRRPPRGHQLACT